MKVHSETQHAAADRRTGDEGAGLLAPLLVDRSAVPAWLPPGQGGSGVVVGELVGIIDDGPTPLVSYPGQGGSRAVPARSTVDVYGPHIGRQVVLTFENADPTKPIIMGVLARSDAHADTLKRTEVEADGERLVITAAKQLVLRCGKASITLTSAGKVLIQGTYVSSKSSGANGIKGASVNIN
jgi:hypothetical protein